MSMTDPISDLLTRIRNGQKAGKAEIAVGASKLKSSVLKVLKDEGYIADFAVERAGAKGTITIALKYHEGRPVIDKLERVSRPGLRIYKRVDQLPVVQGGLGCAIVSTSRGVMTNAQARAEGHGGEVLCIVL